MNTTPELRTVVEVADALKVHPKTVRRWIAEGRLPAVRIGRLVRVPTTALAEFVGDAA